LNKPYTQDQADGQLFFTLTRGRVAMPFYRDALSQRERWDVINYLRSEFGKKNSDPKK
jgi:mono/diheme cytochrome c family protein